MNGGKFDYLMDIKKCVGILPLLLTAGQTTQFILGAAGESDWDVLKRLDWEYREIDLRRGYFSRFFSG